jgi:outer membrane protein OmpA-like peptidoglycan-associated protein
LLGLFFFFLLVVPPPPPRTVAPNSDLVVQVTFTPVNGNVISSQLTVMTDGAPASFNVPLVGDGQTEGIDITVEAAASTMVDLGAIRVGNTESRLVTVENTGDQPLALVAPTSDDARCTIQLVSYPATLAGGASGTFRVHATPTSVGAGACVVSIPSNLPTETVHFAFRGVAPEVQLLNPANGTLDYAGVDVDEDRVEIITVRNSGDYPLTISRCTLGGSPRFALLTSCAAPIVIADGQSTSLQVRFDPLLEAIETASLALEVDALSTDRVEIALRGVGIDQRIDLPALVYELGPVYRNPDPDDAGRQGVQVRNPPHPVTGLSATTTVSMALTDEGFRDIFVVREPGPHEIASGQTIEIPVELHPPSVGSFETRLIIHNDTTALPMAEVTLRGSGVDRNVAVSPNASYDLGRTGVGVPVRLSGLTTGGLVVENVDPDGESYRVRELGFVDAQGNPVAGGPFRLLGAEAVRELPARAAISYDLELAPEEPGEHTIFVAVYLDGDPQPHTQVRFRAEAVAISLGGGGGCQAGRGAGGGALLLVLAVLLGRRRRGLGAAALALLAVGIGATPARAQPTRNLDLATFVPRPATEVEGFAVESPTVGVPGAWAIGLAMSHATNPLTAREDHGDGLDVPVSARTALQIGFAYALFGIVELGARVPFYRQQGSGPEFSGLQAAEGSALGDLAAQAKARLLDSGGLALATSIDVTVPTATDDQYAGIDGPSGHVRAIAGWRGRRAGATANLGFLARQPGHLGDKQQGNAMTFGVGAWLRALDPLWVIGEMFGTSGAGGTGPAPVMRTLDGVQRLEGVLGVRYEVAGGVGISVGGGRGIVSGIGTPDLRGFVLLDVAPRARPVTPLHVRPPPPPRDLGDDDGDGIVNADDACPLEAEDFDGFQDEDGCPDPDNDGDGIPDTLDQCPNEAEDFDGWQDEDGCPDPDNDGDGIPDHLDQCPNEPEDLDGFQDEDGCDDPDNDGDGIPDVIDQCTLEPETINGFQDDDGCPDEGDSLVMVMPDRIEIFEPIQFEGNGARLARKSANVLGQVAATMRANRDFLRVRITVHVHPRGAGDRDLSERRAKAVREWMLQWGVEPERFEARGLGSSRPLVPKNRKGAAQLNDRVEFIILEKRVK